VDFVSSGAVWSQNGTVQMLAPGSTRYVQGIAFDILGALWNQRGSVFISINGNDSCGVTFPQGQPSQWQQLGGAPNFAVTGVHSYDICPAPLPSPVDVPIQSNFSVTHPAVTIRQTTNETQGYVEYVFLSLEEITRNSTVVQQISLQNATWSLGSRISDLGTTIKGSTVSYNYTSILSNGALFDYHFVSTLSSNSTIILANNYTFEIDPRYLKLSILLSFWNWTSVNNRLRFTVDVMPSFNISEQRMNTPIANVTTLFLPSAYPNQSSAFVQLLNFGLTGTHRIPILCSIEANTNTNHSSFAIIFDYFGNTSLYYDPDLSLILGRSESSSPGTADSGDGGLSTTVIIVMSVVIPVAVLAVVTVILLALGAMLTSYLHGRFRKGGMINWNPHDAEGEHETL